MPVGGAIFQKMTTLYSQAEFEELRKIIYRSFDEFCGRDLTEADIYDFVEAGLLEDCLEPPSQ